MGEKPEMKGFRLRHGRNEGGGKAARRGRNWNDLPKRHPTRGVQTPKKPGKTGRAAEKIGCGIGKLSGRENRRSILDRLHSQPRSTDDPHLRQCLLEILHARVREPCAGEVEICQSGQPLLVCQPRVGDRVTLDTSAVDDRTERPIEDHDQSDHRPDTESKSIPTPLSWPWG